MSITIINTKAQPALKGQGVLVTAEDNTNFNELSVNQVCTLDSNGKRGTISWIDDFSALFRIMPQYPYTDLASNGYADVFSATEEIIVTI